MREMTQDSWTNLPFMKMHGLGNDFVVVDARAHDVAITPALAQALGDRHRGVGFDQLAAIGNGAVIWRQRTWVGESPRSTWAIHN